MTGTLAVSAWQGRASTSDSKATLVAGAAHCGAEWSLGHQCQGFGSGARRGDGGSDEAGEKRLGWGHILKVELVGEGERA